MTCRRKDPPLTPGAGRAPPIEPLALRCREAGLTRSEVDLHLPLADLLVDATWSVAAEWGFPEPGDQKLLPSGET